MSEKLWGRGFVTVGEGSIGHLHPVKPYGGRQAFPFNVSLSMVHIFLEQARALL